MNDTPWQSTLRELHGLSRDRRAWIVLVVLGLVVGLVGPLGTYESLPVMPRLAYWMVIVVGTAATGTLVASYMERLLKRHLNTYAAALLSGALAGPFITVVVGLLNVAVFGGDVSFIELLTLGLYCTLISASVTLISAVLQRPSGTSEAVLLPDPPALLERLPRAQRGRLIHLSVADHYVDVTTDKGTSLVLMRLSDAMRETAPIDGLQVHRSHWVAREAVRRGLRQSGKPMLELETGAIVPVSRSYLDAVRAAGLLDG